MRERWIIFTITSGRPPRGMRMLVEPLGLTMPMAAFNGGVIVLPDLSVLDERTLARLPAAGPHRDDANPTVSTCGSIAPPIGTSAPARRRVWTVRPRPFSSSPPWSPTFDEVLSGIVKVVGVSDDHPRVAACEAAVQQEFGTLVSAARSQPHYLDVTHPTANKGVVIERLSRYLKIPLRPHRHHRRPAE